MATINIGPVDNFHELSVAEATDVLYDELIPACEAKGIHLSQYGNHNAPGSLVSNVEYENKKATRTLFDVEKVQLIFSRIQDMIAAQSTYKTGSYGLKHRVEERIGEYVTNGDCIAAMLLHGYAARFGKRGETLAVNAEFKVKVV